MNHHNTGAFAFPDAVKMARLSVQGKLPAVFAVGNTAVEDMNQCGFSCAVFTGQHVDIPAADLQIHIVQRFHTGKDL